jgi:hypothetical protein
MCTGGTIGQGGARRTAERDAGREAATTARPDVPHQHAANAEVAGWTHALPSAQVGRISGAASRVVANADGTRFCRALGTVARRGVGLGGAAATGLRPAGGGASGAEVPCRARAVARGHRLAVRAPETARAARVLQATHAEATAGARRRVVPGGVGGAHGVLARRGRLRQPAALRAVHVNAAARDLRGACGGRGAVEPRRAQRTARWQRQLGGRAVHASGARCRHATGAKQTWRARGLGLLVSRVLSRAGQCEEPRGGQRRCLHTLHTTQHNEGTTTQCAYHKLASWNAARPVPSCAPSHTSAQ